MEQVPEEHLASEAQTTYVVVLRARSSARLKPEDGFEVVLDSVPGGVGPVRFRVRTRWVDEGHEAPIPRELWIEARGPAPSLNDAVGTFGSTGRFFSGLLALTANTAVEMPEVHLAYDAGPNVTEREFLEVFLPDEKGHPREGRLVLPNELVAAINGFSQSAEHERLRLAMQQYGLALRHWYFGGEWLALAHLYMAAEALTDPVIAQSCGKAGLDEEAFARRQGIDTTDTESWRHQLQIWGRRDVIFEGDNATYRLARRTSDGIEHGFLEFHEINRNAIATAETTFRYVRKSLLGLLGISPEEFGPLYARAPRDIGSLRKIVRGHFVGDGCDPAPPSEEYPYLEWMSAIKTFKREAETFTLSFEENFTVRCAPSYGFRGVALEVRGRAEPGVEPIKLNEVAKIAVTAATNAPTNAPTNAEIFSLMRRAAALATATAAPSTSIGIPWLMSNVFGLFAEQVSLFEAIEVLLRDNRPVEAIVLLRSLILGACQLEGIAYDPNPIGAAVRVKLDSLERQANLFESTDQIRGAVQTQLDRYRRAAAERKVSIPASPPDISNAPFYAKSVEPLQFSDEVARPSDFASTLHTKWDNDGGPSLHTRIADATLLTGVGVDAVNAITASAVALAKALDWPLDEGLVAEINSHVERLSDEGDA